MTRPISEDLRRRILKVRETTGKTYEELAEQFQVGRATVNRLLRNRPASDVARGIAGVAVVVDPGRNVEAG
ncbi:helix-turn-helix domain-containing protein [Myxococcus sp. AS-1-15]|uniref:helix-turn-helix domain-containing protein n=1 Tax=Myxococcus sp. AS-1-15 TaxID=2874600 RepID=UPI001CBA700C|nr:helix-turn-helix domain-containing protein [Myxococcus sp. AS-1-15]MBZ4401592.1 hypothetical protein [Myxococcus sp. AS-1-15]BDT35544.1 hypothetical protein MFMH1_52130 [Myxococcus sp. MH1]